MKKFLALSALVCACVTAQAQPRHASAPPPVKRLITKQTIKHGGRERTFYLYVPPSLDTARPAPLVVTLHGSGRDGRSLVEHWRDLADDEGVILVGPDALDPQRWSIPEDGPDLLRDIVERVSAEHPVNARRLYLFGHSAGANSAVPLSLFESEYFAATAAHAGGMRPERFNLIDLARRKIPLAVVVGRDDPGPLAVARATHDELTRRGFAPVMHELAGHDHDYYRRAKKINRQVWDFFRQHELASEPRYTQYNWAGSNDAAAPGAQEARDEITFVPPAPEPIKPAAPPRLQGVGETSAKPDGDGAVAADAKELEVEEDDVVGVETSLVTVPVTVTERGGRHVTDLRREEFRVFEDGAEQEVAFFEPTESPVTVALLLDVSDSTKFRLKEIKHAALAFLEQLRPEDRVLVVSFDRRVRLLAEATSDRAALAAAVERLEDGTGTSLYNAIDTILLQRLRHIRGRKAVVIFSDGIDTASAGATYDSNLAHAEESGATVYTVRYDTFDSAARNLIALRQAQGPGMVTTNSTRIGRRSASEVGTAFLYELSYRTGGRALSADTEESLTKAFAQIAEELRRQYALGYYPARPPSPGRPRSIKVRVARPKVSVRARRSYAVAAKRPRPAKN